MVRAAPSGLPPTVGASQARAPPSPQDAATLAAAAVASIVDVRPTPPPPPPKRRRNRKRANADTPDEAAEADGDLDGAGPSQPIPRPPKRPSVRRRNPRNEVEEPDELSDPDAPPVGPRVIKRKGMYGSAGVAGTSQDRRLKANRKAKTVQVEAVSESVLDTAQPEELIGEEIDPSTVTIGDLATHTGIGTGHVSARGIRLHKHRSEELANRRKAAEARQIIRWQEKQIQRRKLRAMKNAERARRRRQMEEMGEDSAVISPDEEDSEEEYAMLPERLTPPTTPEPDDDPRRPLDDGQTDGLERENGEQMDVDHDNADENGDAEPLEDGQGREEDLDAMLRRGGFNLNAEDRPDAEGDEDDENGDGDNDFRYDEDEDANNLADFRARQEEERRRILEGAQDRVVEEDDDETRMINNASFSKKNTPNERWSTAETEFFFLILGETGENYSYMKAYFPGRTVQQLKRKGLRENRDNPEKMTQAIMERRRPIDKLYLQKAIGLDPDGSMDRVRALLESARQDKESLTMPVVEEEEAHLDAEDGAGEEQAAGEEEADV